ncbi:hypothetical protein CCAN2_1770011 [Capnocytophaga canimorsus]|nr:hypothetical protein CCAN2_1770011 [Capnocytophaga canimorsus]
MVVNFYISIKKSIQNNETYRIYRENTEFYISGQVFKVDVPEDFWILLYPLCQNRFCKYIENI